MTCVISTSPWHTLSDSFSWAPMNPDTTPPHHNLERQTSHGYASSESESRKPSGSSGKKRASRAGTRSVTTLSAAQLERKRANDREAQRAIRQRTKDHIEQLENSISELRGSHESSEKLVAVTQQRNRELEEENVFLRGKLSEAGYAVNLPPVESQRQQDTSMLSVHPTSPAAQGSGLSIQRPPSTSTPRSLSVTTSRSSNSRHGSFQYPATQIAGPSGATMNIPSASPLVNNPGLTTWRSHDGVTSVQPTPMQVPDPQVPPATSYAPGAAADRMEWASGTQGYRYSIGQEQQRAQQQYEATTPAPPPPQQPQQYVQQPVPNYVPPPSVAQQQAYHPPQAVPSAEFQNMAVSSPATFQSAPATYQAHQHQAAYQQQTQHPQGYQPNLYQITPMQAPQPAPEYVSPQGQMQPPPLPTANYHPPPNDGHYAAQVPAPMQAHPQDPKFQDSRGYPSGHYPQS